jgi:hypothetical protein
MKLCSWQLFDLKSSCHAKLRLKLCSLNLKQQNGVHHYKELVETIKIDILFAIFGAPNKKILILQIKNKC